MHWNILVRMSVRDAKKERKKEQAGFSSIRFCSANNNNNSAAFTRRPTHDKVEVLGQTLAREDAAVGHHVGHVHVLRIDKVAGGAELGRRGGLNDAGAGGQDGQETQGQNVVGEEVGFKGALVARLSEGEGAGDAASVLCVRERAYDRPGETEFRGAAAAQ